MKLPIHYLLSTILGIYLSSATVFAAPVTTNKACYSPAELNDFKKIYFDLQSKLNYEGTDAVYDEKSGQLKQKSHEANTPYGGKEFELAIFKEYQNSLRKVGRLYQAAKFDGDNSFKSNPVLVKFMEAIEDKNSDSTPYAQQTKIDEVIKALEEASIKKFGTTTDKKYVLNAGDKYLLGKLLTHAQDRICNLATYDKNGNKDTFYFKKEDLEKWKNAPLNRLVNTLKNANLNKDSKIDLMPTSSLSESLIDSNAAIQSALAENVNDLSAWVKKMKARGDNCLQSLKSKAFANSIQLNIQSCNLGHFIDTLSEDNVSNLEAVLHYINSNEKFLNMAQAKAETALDELTLESMINNTYANVGARVGCSIITAENGKKKIFVRNIKCENNKCDTSKVSCKIKGKELKPSECAQKLEFVSDEYGRGLEVRQKAKSGPVIAISIPENPNCTDIGLADETPPAPEAGNLLTAEMCKIKSEETGINLVLSDDKTECIRPPRPYVERPMLELKDEMTAEKCAAKGNSFVFDKVKKSCTEKVEAKVDEKIEEKKEDRFEDKCAEEGLKKDPKQYLMLGEDKKSCVTDKKAECNARQDAWVEEKNDGVRSTKYAWNSKNNTCDDKKPDPKAEKEDGESDEGEAPTFAPKQAPGRFVPIGVPNRQQWQTQGAK